MSEMIAINFHTFSNAINKWLFRIFNNFRDGVRKHVVYKRQSSSLDTYLETMNELSSRWMILSCCALLFSDKLDEFDYIHKLTR